MVSSANKGLIFELSLRFSIDEMHKLISKFTILIIFTFSILSCGRKTTSSFPEAGIQPPVSGQPPAYVQKAWDARYSYDADRRLLVPEYAGSRWGAVQQYKEEGELVYQDWWIRDVRSEDLEAAPDTAITSFLDDDGNVTIIPQNVEDPFAEQDDANDESVENLDEGVSENEEPSISEDESPFVPSPFSPF